VLTAHRLADIGTTARSSVPVGIGPTVQAQLLTSVPSVVQPSSPRWDRIYDKVK
jgi:hypothetical protein